MANVPTIRIDQATVGNGAVSTSRTDGVLSQVVTLNDTANTSGAYAWVLLIPRGSSAALSDASAAAPTFTPDVAGSYLAFCTVDGTASFSLNAAGARVPRVGGGDGFAVLLNGLRLPTAGETTQFDATEGWADVLDQWFRVLSDTFSGSQGDVFYRDSSGNLAGLGAGSNGQVLTSGGAAADPSWTTVAGTGDVVGPASSTDNAVARFDSTTGKLLQDSPVIIDNSGNVTGLGTVDGRDVATDGTKLDGIEAAADVTDATNVAAAGAVMDSDLTAGSGVMRKTGAGAYEANDTFQAAVGGLVTALTDSATVAVDASDGNLYTVTLAGNRTLGAPSNAKTGQVIQILITQDATGTRTLAYNAVWNFEGGTAPVLSTGGSDVDLLSAVTFNGTDFYATLIKGWS